MKEHTIKQCVKIMLENWNNNKTRPTYHYAFGIRKNKIIAVGKNKPEYPSQKVLNLAYTYDIEKWKNYPFFHAESDLVTKLPKDIKPKDLEILSIRINRHAQFRLAKPCKNCQKMLDSMGIQKILWSCNDSEDKSRNLILHSQNKIILHENKLFFIS
jgi:deoxycytidylate deaminase